MFALGSQLVTAAAQTAVELEVDLLEVHLGQGNNPLALDSTLTLGDGADQLLVKVAGGSEMRTAFDDFELQALYSRSLADTVALQFGVRHDLQASSDLTYGIAGPDAEVLPGLEAEHYWFVSQDGDLTGAGQLLLRMDLAPRLALEPRLSIGWSAQGVLGEDLGNGLTDVEALIRLRHALSDNLNFYNGVVHERLVGSSRSIAVAAGNRAQVTPAMVGFCFSF